MNEPLVLLPGMMCDARIFAPQIFALSTDMAVMAAPITHGERIEEIASHILSLAPSKFALAGLSMGGIVALEILRRAPERVTRLALMDTSPMAESPAEAAAREVQIVGARSGRMLEVIRDDMLPNVLRPGPERGDQQALMLDMAADLGPEVFVRQTRALQRRRDHQMTLRKIRQPALILCGADDTLTPPKRHEFMAQLIEFAQLRVIDGAGHLPVLDQPAAVTAALRDWMKQPLVLR
ncbi:alpha/beta fold hydrolase [Octadecabacter sp. SW4]|uniref:alpha/beta fold hydrolase n=1 Tax=Octadecabacter sp. SW4 TaxID=2602067 RepID=UPI0011C1F4FE|nr:alpha/beta fold hydrolase [Octadecabacter sp. SW4]QEE35093.1 alpha/beta fold hydrolase [Octadecabacter sp. SW4]